MKLRWRPAQSLEPEWIDLPGHAPDLLAANLNDLRRVNRLLGGVRLTLCPLARFERRLPPGATLRVLDVATGGADIPRAIARWAAARGRPLQLVASDAAEAIVALARAQTWREFGGLPAAGAPAGRGGAVREPIVFVVADAPRLPFVDGAFHVAAASLALHHLPRPQAREMLAEMARCASLGVVVNDIVRSWLTYYGAVMATRLGSRNPLTRHDGPLSARRAYTRHEMAVLARAAGLEPRRWDGFLAYRVALTAIPTVRRLPRRHRSMRPGATSSPGWTACAVPSPKGHRGR